MDNLSKHAKILAMQQVFCSCNDPLLAEADFDKLMGASGGDVLDILDSLDVWVMYEHLTVDSILSLLSDLAAATQNAIDDNNAERGES